MNIDELATPAFARLLLRRWYILAGLMLVASLLAAGTYALLPQRYLVSATVIGTRYQSDVTPNSQSVASASAAALLGLGSADLPSISDFRLYTQLLSSPELGAAILDDPVMHRVLAEQWKTDHWAAPDTLRQRLKNFVSGIFGRRGWYAPDGYTVSRYIGKNLSIEPSKKEKLLTLGIWVEDPELGRDLILLLNSRADAVVRQMAQKRFQAKVDFLEKSIAANTVQEARSTLGTALARAETDRIYSYSSLPFAAEFLSPPSFPPQPGAPNFAIIFVLFGMAGAVMFFIHSVIVYQRQRAAVLPVRDALSARPAASSPPQSSSGN